MSSKKAPVKETKPAAKKGAEKKAAPEAKASKAAAKPAKASSKKAAEKVTDKKGAGKTATSSVAKKPAVTKAATKDSKVTVTKKTSKAADSKPVKADDKKGAKVKPATEPAKSTKDTKTKPANVKQSSDAKASGNVKAASAGAKSPTKAGSNKKTPAPKPEVEKAPAVTKNSKNGTKGGASAKPETSSSKPVPAPEPPRGGNDKPVKKGNDYDYAVLLEGVKKLSKAIMFTEVDEQEDRSNKKKMSSEMKNMDMKPTASIRRKASLAEETQEELTERILKELEEQNLAFEREAATQMCTRCNRNLVSPEFWVDKHLGYCEECAMILKLGQSKEARKVEYQLGGMGDSLDEEDDEIIGPDADDLKDAEEDLADMDD
ncbi:MAG: hypothetical protein MJY87_00505 [Fibrobacter sp.]|nr:hypothetical protein [Fibrobacter sp.]